MSRFHFAAVLAVMLAGVAIPGVSPNELCERGTTDSELSEQEQVRDGEGTIASTRDARAPRTTPTKSTRG